MSYIGKNPKVDSVKLDESATVPSGANAEGQLYFNSGTGSISRGLKVYKNSQFVAIDKQLGDADTFHLLKASDLAISEFSAARNSTSTSFLNQNAVPFETTTASGAAGTFSNTSTGDALLTDESADLVFAYKSSGTSDDAQEYFGIPLSVPKAFRGGNVVLTFEYRTGFGTGTTATVDGDFEVAVLDKSTGNGGQTTTTATSGTAIAAGSNIAVASKTGLAVGQRIRLETGSSTIAAGSPDATVTEAFITSISTSTDHITISESYAPPSTSGGRITSGWLTDVVPGQLPAADSQTNKQGKKFSIQFKTEDDTSDIVLFFQNKNTSSTISRHLFVDNILLSANKFLQASSQLKSEYYYASGNSNFWNDLNSNSGWDADLVVPGFGAPLVSQSKFLRFEETSTTDTRVYARQDIELAVSFTGHAQAGNQIKIYNSSGEILAQQQTPDPAGHVQVNSVFVSIALAKDDYMYCVNDRGSTASNRYGAASFLATGRNSDVIILESQDEIFTDWNDAGAMTVTQTTTTGSKPSSIETDQVYWRRDGSDMLLKWTFYASDKSGGTSGTGDYLFHLPTGYHMDAGRVKYYTTNEGYGDFTTQSSTMLGYGQIQDNSGGAHIRVNLYAYDSNKFRAAGLVTTHSTVTRHSFVGSDNGYTWANMNVWTFEARIPIAGFNANFNPLLSLPLVEIGSDCEYYNFRNVGNPSSGKTYRFLARSTGTEVVNTIDKLGTVTNDTTNGWYFQASQRVKVHFAVGMACSTTSAGFGIVKLPNHPSTYSDNPWGNSQWDDLGVGGTQDTRTGAGYQGATTASFIMEAGEYIQAVSDNTNFQSSTKSGLTLLVERDRSNTNMAHIIKPAVAILEDRKPEATQGGTNVEDAYTSRILNTLKGDSWFVTGSFDGIGGTNTDFTLEPGTYKFNSTSVFYNTGDTINRLYDVTNSKEIETSLSIYFEPSEVDMGYAEIKTVFTIGSSTTFRIQYFAEEQKGTNGLGSACDITGRDEVYTRVIIEKLK